MPTSDNIFVVILKKVGDFFSDASFLNAQMTSFVTTLLSIVGSYLLVWIMYRGYKILWGRSNDNIKDFMWDAFLKFIFIFICLYPEIWLSLVTATLQELRDIKIGTFTYTSMLQWLWDKGFQVSKLILDEYTGFTKPFTSFYAVFCLIGVLIGTFIGCVSMLMVWIINYVGFSFLLAIAPFAFYCLIFGNFLQPIFKQWLMLTLSSILTLLFLNIFLSFLYQFLVVTMLEAVKNISTASLMQISGIFIVAGLLIKIFISLTTSIVEKMVGIGIDSSVGGAVRGAMGTAGTIGGLGMLGGAKLAKGLSAGGGKLSKWGIDKAMNTNAGQKATNLFKNRKSFRLGGNSFKRM